jgi:DNA-binding transcriptional regulator YiaG
MSAIAPAELRRILDKLDMTLAELAGLCHVHPVTVRKWSSTEVPNGPAVVLIRLLAAGKVSARMIEQVGNKS